MKTLACLGAAVAALGVSVGAASAATTTFDFRNGSNLVNSLVYTQGDLTVTVTGQGDNGSSRKVRSWGGSGGGIGVQTGNSIDPHHTIDSIGIDDIAVLTFSKAVTITSLAFRYISAGAEFDFRVGPAPLVERTANIDARSTVTHASFASYESTVFGIEASCAASLFGVCLKESAFKLAGVTVTYDDPPVPVPVPAAGALLVGALGALGALRRRA